MGSRIHQPAASRPGAAGKRERENERCAESGSWSGRARENTHAFASRTRRGTRRLSPPKGGRATTITPSPRAGSSCMHHHRALQSLRAAPRSGGARSLSRSLARHHTHVMVGSLSLSLTESPYIHTHRKIARQEGAPRTRRTRRRKTTPKTRPRSQRPIIIGHTLIVDPPLSHG